VLLALASTEAKTTAGTGTDLVSVVLCLQEIVSCVSERVRAREGERRGGVGAAG
jgi:hypothetical protein